MFGEELLFKDEFGDLTQQHESEIPLQLASDDPMPSLHHCWGLSWVPAAVSLPQAAVTRLLAPAPLPSLDQVSGKLWLVRAFSFEHGQP